MNMKYLLRTGCTRYMLIYNDIQQVRTGYKREAYLFDITKSWIILFMKTENVRTYFEWAYIFKGEDVMVFGASLMSKLQ